MDNIYHLTLGSGGATQSSSKLDPEKPYVSVYEEGTFYTRFTVSGDDMKVEAFEHTGNGEIAQTPVDTFTIHASDN